MKRGKKSIRDFTPERFTELLDAFLAEGYTFQTMEQFIARPALKTVILRHDVDKRPSYSLRTGKLEKERGITGTYYFRITRGSNDPAVIRELVNLEHEIGYHYEDLASFKGNVSEAIFSFERNLAYFRKFYPVRTICMHGSPYSKWDNRDLWRSYSYRDFEISAEPYFDIDFSHVLYLTDTGRRWDGEKASVRDKVRGSSVPGLRQTLRSTEDIITALRGGELPGQVMLTVHPQRWCAGLIPWFNELVFQSLKNLIKQLFFVKG
jgi:hypothetical protein